MCRTFWHYQKSITTAHTAQELVIRFLRHFLFMTLECSQSVERAFYCSFQNRLQFTRAIRKTRLRRSPLLRSSFLLIKWRSLRAFLEADFHASMKSAYKKVRVNCNQNCKLILNFLFFSCFCSCTRAIIDHKISKFRYKSTMVFDEFQLSCLFSDISSFLCMFRLSFAQQAFLFLLHWYSHILFSERRYFHGTSGYE